MPDDFKVGDIIAASGAGRHVQCQAPARLVITSRNGAFAASQSMAVELAQSLVTVANGAGLPTRAWITDMNQVLGDSCGNAVEMSEAVEFLQGRRREPRLLEVTRVLSSELLLIGGLALDQAQALRQVDTALDSGAAPTVGTRMPCSA